MSDIFLNIFMMTKINLLNNAEIICEHELSIKKPQKNPIWILSIDFPIQHGKERWSGKK